MLCVSYFQYTEVQLAPRSYQVLGVPRERPIWGPNLVLESRVQKERFEDKELWKVK